jgi:hypothetical protein
MGSGGPPLFPARRLAPRRLSLLWPDRFAAGVPGDGAASAGATAEADLAAARTLFETNLDAIRQRDRDAYLACYLESERLARTGPGGVALGFEALGFERRRRLAGPLRRSRFAARRRAPRGYLRHLPLPGPLRRPGGGRALGKDLLRHPRRLEDRGHHRLRRAARAPPPLALRSSAPP